MRESALDWMQAVPTGSIQYCVVGQYKLCVEYQENSAGWQWSLNSNGQCINYGFSNFTKREARVFAEDSLVAEIKSLMKAVERVDEQIKLYEEQQIRLGFKDNA